MSDSNLLHQRMNLIKARIHNVVQVFVEIAQGFIQRDHVLVRFIQVGIAIVISLFFHFDVWLFERVGLVRLYPSHLWSYRCYSSILTWLSILLYGVWMRNQKNNFARRLKEVFDLIGLRNSIGGYPNFLSLESLTGETMKLKLTNGAFPLSEWQKRKEKLEANLNVFIDEIREIPEKGLIEITFSYDPMPSKVTIENILGFRDYQFFIGRDRTRNYIGSFSESPHLLVAGETGGGKSAFMRQVVTTIKLNQPEAEFHMVDLKGGVDFGFFEKFPGMKVITEVSGVSAALPAIVGAMKTRSQALKERKLTKIEEFFETTEFRRLSTTERAKHILGRRIFVVVDECAEIFLFGLGHDPKQTREIRGAMSSITRLGRFVGVHVILGTQRPDKQAVDPQVKSNLTSTICFRIHDLGGSLAILGTGRATDLPKLPGRAILAAGSDEGEIQTPLLAFKDCVKLLEEKFGSSSIDETSVKETETGESVKASIETKAQSYSFD